MQPWPIMLRRESEKESCDGQRKGRDCVGTVLIESTEDVKGIDWEETAVVQGGRQQLGNGLGGREVVKPLQKRVS